MVDCYAKLIHGGRDVRVVYFGRARLFFSLRLGGLQAPVAVRAPEDHNAAANPERVDATAGASARRSRGLVFTPAWLGGDAHPDDLRDDATRELGPKASSFAGRVPCAE